MNLKKIFFSAVTVSVLCALTGCDYIQEGKPESSLLKQEEEHNNKIVLLEKQQAQLKSQLETIQKQQTGIINSTKTLTHVIKSVKDQQNTFIFTEFNPAKTKYFILIIEYTYIIHCLTLCNAFLCPDICLHGVMSVKMIRRDI